MKLDISILRYSFRKYLCNMDFLEKYNAENLQDFAQTQFDFEFFLDDCDQNVNVADAPKLWRRSAEFVELSDCQSRQSKVVR